MPSPNQKTTSDEFRQYLVKARAVLAEQRAAAIPDGLDDVIIADLRNPDLTYLEIAFTRKASLRRICKLAKANGLTRYAPRKAKG